ncbi:hypothetical protein CERZMDRAFT_90030 [Cercospora zeae-maydis SCOH1-5]|uniref:Uncharacterized protein n=1 Tax=Cercospora zeae-maydis SCOH1-5 TaxID=717836 RepID=A0A6A6FRZ9_9PEZI|nr:hypothetical protein CERZMDRAFT_90030 [Cercospora zeae-maydis SCOH1-5]
MVVPAPLVLSRTASLRLVGPAKAADCGYYDEAVVHLPAPVEHHEEALAPKSIFDEGASSYEPRYERVAGRGMGRHHWDEGTTVSRNPNRER